MGRRIMDFKSIINIAKGIGGLAGIYYGGQDARRAAQVQAQMMEQSAILKLNSAKAAAEALRDAAKAEEDAFQFNSEVRSINTQRKLRAVALEYQGIIGSQLTGQAAQGVSVGSKSALMLRNEAVNNMQREILSARQDADNERKAAEHELRMRQASLRNQANAVEYEGRVQKGILDTQASQKRLAGKAAMQEANMKVLKGIPNILDQISRTGKGKGKGKK